MFAILPGRASREVSRARVDGSINLLPLMAMKQT
jgi:hypothetical protein